MTKDNQKTMLKAVIPIMIAFISIFAVARFTTSTEFHAKTIESLDQKKDTVMKLKAASTAASAAITLIPSDVGTPIAEKIADLSSYFLIVLCAIFLEKYLVTMTGYATFTILIPIACALISANVFLKNEALKKLTAKIILFGAAIFLVIPLSVKVSNMIEATYSSSIETTITDAQEATEEIEDGSEDEGVLSGIASKLENGVTDITTKIKSTLNNFMEAIAVMLVTSCLIPILVLLFFVWLIKVLLGVDINIPPLPNKKGHSI